jgi:NADH-quinone oxidoreductase subunit C
MTVVLSGQAIASNIAAQFPQAGVEASGAAVLIKSDSLVEVAGYLKNNPQMAFDLLVDITSVDYWDYFELVYRFTSLELNHSLVLKVRCPGREKPHVPSLTGLWKGADLMEREVFDLMGISFTGHPNMKRIFLWEGFTGYPLRKDYL